MKPCALEKNMDSQRIPGVEKSILSKKRNPETKREKTEKRGHHNDESNRGYNDVKAIDKLTEKVNK